MDCDHVINISEHYILQTFSWHIRCPTNKYWAEKFSFAHFKFKEKS